MEQEHKFTVRKISRIAQSIDDYTSYSKKKNLIWAFSEFDVTQARESLNHHKKQTGESVSFTAFLINVFARVVEKHKFPVNTIRKKKSEFYTFDEVDVMTNIEKEVDGIKKPVSYTVRNAHRKTLREIHEEIRAAQKVKNVSLSSDKGKGKKIVKLFPKLPRFIRKMVVHRIFSNPEIKKKIMGTVGVTSVGMFGNDLGFMIHITPHTLSMGVGAIGTRLRKIDGEIVEREMLGATIAMDHAIIDGGPATRFFQDLYSMIVEECHDKEWCFKSLKE